MSEGVNAEGKPYDKIKIRTILSSKCKVGICAKCYGANMATGEAVQVGESVGIIAAQSIGAVYYTHLAQDTQLRKKLREAGVVYKVYKRCV